MTEAAEKQKELFEEFENQSRKLSFFKKNKQFLQNRIFVFQFSREKLALLLLGLVVLISVAFCLGVERGKDLRPQVMIAPRAPVEKSAPPEPQAKPSLPAQPTVKLPVGKGSVYTIRVATYINKNSAEKAAVKIKQSGFPVYTKASGRSFMICVGDYNDKKQAESALLRLKKTYKDSYIKTTKK